MQIKDLSGKVTSAKLNESLAKTFGYRLQIEKFTDSQLQSAKAKLSEQVNKLERTSSFDSLVEADEYQKTQAMLGVIRQAIKERTLSESQEALRDKYSKGMQKTAKQFEERFGAHAKDMMHATATKMAKTESLDDALTLLRGVLSERTLTEGEEEKAALIMSARDMVDKITGWLEDVATMRAENMLDLVDSIRDELGNDVSEQFSSSAKPALDDLYTSLETNRTAMAQAVSSLTGEPGPGAAPMGADMGAGMDMDMPDMEAPDDMEIPPVDDADMEMPEMPPEADTRLKRESVEYSRKMGKMLSSKKK